MAKIQHADLHDVYIYYGVAESHDDLCKALYVVIHEVYISHTVTVINISPEGVYITMT